MSIKLSFNRKSSCWSAGLDLKMDQPREDHEQEYKDLLSNPFAALFPSTAKAAEYRNLGQTENSMRLPTNSPNICLKDDPISSSALAASPQEGEQRVQELNDLFQRVFLVTINAGRKFQYSQFLSSSSNERKSELSLFHYDIAMFVHIFL